MAREVQREKLAAGTHPRTTALDIVGRMNNATGKREGGFIGLTTQQARWALNAEDQLRNAHLPGEIDPVTGQRKPFPGSVYLGRQRRDARFDARVREAMTSGKQIAEADIQRIVTRYVASTAQLPIARGGRMPVKDGHLRKSLVSELNGAEVAKGSESFTVVASDLKMGDSCAVAWTAAHALRQELGFVGEDSKARTYNQLGKHFAGSAAAQWESFVAKNAAKVLSL